MGYEVERSSPEGRGETRASSREHYVRGHEEDGAPGGQLNSRGAKKGQG